jgi:deferrochelatase/peroxidase EfeB
MTGDFRDVQRIVLVGDSWQEAAHLILDFGPANHSYARRLAFLWTLLQNNWITPAGIRGNRFEPQAQWSLGFSRIGLERVGVPDHVRACFASKAPAFTAGAAQRAAPHLGLTGENAPERWDDRFAHGTLHAVLTIHTRNKHNVQHHVAQAQALAATHGIGCRPLDPAETLDPPPGKQGNWVHFGYRDGLARVGIEGWTSDQSLRRVHLPVSRHKAGEFVLGHAPDRGADRWNAGPGLRVWPDETRAFFHNGSFGVLQQIEQRVAAFEAYVEREAAARKVPPDEIKALLCGRTPEGVPLAAPANKPEDDFDYAQDPDGARCPFGSHVRRLNPRVPPDGTGAATPDRYPAHFSRARPLLRRGMPYGSAWTRERANAVERGLMGQFFCASIESQYEHLLGQWSDRVPLGSPDKGGARDPFIGAHSPADGPFIHQVNGRGRKRLAGMTPFTRTRGVAYLFYPSLTTLHGIADSRMWGRDDEERST